VRGRVIGKVGGSKGKSRRPARRSILSPNKRSRGGDPLTPAGKPLGEKNLKPGSYYDLQREKLRTVQKEGGGGPKEQR